VPPRHHYLDMNRFKSLAQLLSNLSLKQKLLTLGGAYLSVSVISAIVLPTRTPPEVPVRSESVPRVPKHEAQVTERGLNYTYEIPQGFVQEDGGLSGWYTG
jgi:hypothetical protein